VLVHLPLAGPAAGGRARPSGSGWIPVCLTHAG